VVHTLPGRTRIRFPARRGDAAFLGALADTLRELPGVTAAAANPRTASLAIHHRGSFEAIAAAAREAGLFSVASSPPPVRARPRRRYPPPQPLMLLATGFAGLAVLQAARGRIVGSAVETLWHGYQARRKLGMPPVVAGLAGIGLIQLVRGQLLGPASSLLFHALMAQQMARENGGR
jgi:hypothetical protein